MSKIFPLIFLILLIFGIYHIITEQIKWNREHPEGINRCGLNINKITASQLKECLK